VRNQVDIRAKEKQKYQGIQTRSKDAVIDEFNKQKSYRPSFDGISCSGIYIGQIIQEYKALPFSN